MSVVATAPGASGALQLDPVQVQGNIVPPQAEIGNLPAPFAGGEVARGNRASACSAIATIWIRRLARRPTQRSTSRTTRQGRWSTRSSTIRRSVRVYAQGAYGDGLLIRGFYLGLPDMAFNGLYGVNPQNSINLLGIERIEIFRGPSALLSGMAPSGAVGGTINFVPKRATDAPITQATANYASASQFGGSFDVGRRFGPDNALGLRVNAGYSGGQTPVDGQSNSLLGVTVGFDFRSENTRMDADFGYQNRNIIGAQGGTAVAAGLIVPAAPKSSLLYYQPWSLLSRPTTRTATFASSMTLSPNLTRLRESRWQEDEWVVSARLSRSSTTHKARLSRV